MTAVNTPVFSVKSTEIGFVRHFLASLTKRSVTVSGRHRLPSVTLGPIKISKQHMS